MINFNGPIKINELIVSKNNLYVFYKDVTVGEIGSQVTYSGAEFTQMICQNNNGNGNNNDISKKSKMEFNNAVEIKKLVYQ